MGVKGKKSHALKRGDRSEFTKAAEWLSTIVTQL